MWDPFSVKFLEARSEIVEPPPKALGTIDRWLDRYVWSALGIFALAAAFFLGGLHPRGQLTLAVATFTAAIALLALAWRRGPSSIWSVTPIHGLTLAAALLVLAQLVPLPAALLGWCSPSIDGLLPLWSGANDAAADFPRWATISLSPMRTEASLTMLVVYGLLFGLTYQMARNLEGVERILRRLAVTVVIVATLGLAQFGLGDTNFLGLYEYPPASIPGIVRGPFIDPRHLAYFLALGIGPLAWLMQRSLAAHRDARRAGGAKASCEATKTGWKLWWRLVALVLLLAAVWMTRSRIGIVTFLLTFLGALGLFWRAKLIEWRIARVAGGVAIAICLVAIARGPAPSGTPFGGDLEAYIAKRGLIAEQGSSWTTDWQTLRNFWRFGTGVGSYHDVAPCYSTELLCAERPHAVNEYVQTALDLGLGGLLLLAAGVSWLGWRCYQATQSPGAAPRIQGGLAAVAPSLLASVLVAGFDGVWHVPACLTMTVLLAACGLRLAQFALPTTPAMWRLECGRGLVATVSVVVLLLGAWVIDERGRTSLSVSHWIGFMHTAMADLDSRAKVPDDVVANHLEQVLYWTPKNARAHLKLAAAMLAEGTQTTGGNQEALEHARRGVELCPLAGEGYLALAELERRGVRAGSPVSALLRQAITVRPHDAQVLLVAGREALAAGDLPGALEHWRQVYSAGKIEQTRLIEAFVAGRVPVAVILAEFKPDLDATRLLDAKYSPLLSAEKAKPLIEYYQHVAEQATIGLNEDRAALLWSELEGLHERLGQHTEALACLRRAAAGRPNDCELRANLAERLVRNGHDDEAEMHIRWCLQRHPDDSRLRALLDTAQCRQKHESASAKRRFR